MIRYDNGLEDFPLSQTYTSTERHSRISAEVLAGRFGIGIERARETLRSTVQRVTRSDILNISRRYRAERQHTVKQMNKKLQWTKYGRSHDHQMEMWLAKSIVVNVDSTVPIQYQEPTMGTLVIAWMIL